MPEPTRPTTRSGSGTIHVDVEERIEREGEPVGHISARRTVTAATAAAVVVRERSGVGFVVDVVGIVSGGGGVVISVAGGEVGRRHEDDGRVCRVDGFGGDAGEGVGGGAAGKVAVVCVCIVVGAVGAVGVQVRSSALVLVLGMRPRGMVGAGCWNRSAAAAGNVVVVVGVVVVGC